MALRFVQIVVVGRNNSMGRKGDDFRNFSISIALYKRNGFLKFFNFYDNSRLSFQIYIFFLLFTYMKFDTSYYMYPIFDVFDVSWFLRVLVIFYYSSVRNLAHSSRRFFESWNRTVWILMQDGTSAFFGISFFRDIILHFSSPRFDAHLLESYFSRLGPHA